MTAEIAKDESFTVINEDDNGKSSKSTTPPILLNKPNEAESENDPTETDPRTDAGQHSEQESSAKDKLDDFEKALNAQILTHSHQSEKAADVSSAGDRGTNKPEDELQDCDVEDETYWERFCALSEMFPDWLRNGVWYGVSGTAKTTKTLWKFSKSASWIFFSSATILLAPAAFEIERFNAQQAEMQQQRQILLGPKAAGVAGAMKAPPLLAPTPIEQQQK